MCKVLATFWFHQKFFTRQNDCHIPNFKAAWRTAQVDIISPNLFNMVVDNVVRTWLVIIIKDQIVALEGLVLNVGRCLVFFYANDAMVWTQ